MTAELFAAALIVGAAAAGTAADGPRPIRLEVEVRADRNVVHVVGESPTACSATYALEVSDPRGGNRSTTRGKANLAPGKRQMLATVATGPGKLAARLDVEPCGGPPYEQSWGSR